MDVKSWLEQAGIPVADTYFPTEPQTPFLVFHDIETYEGADMKTNIIGHALTVNLFTVGIDSATEDAVEALFFEKGSSFQKERTWDNEKARFVIIYTVGTLTEKLN